MDPGPDAVERRDQLVREACRQAGLRLAASTTPDTALIATGEILFWVVAADDSMLRSRPGYAAYRNEESEDRRLLMQGLRYPRNVLAHESEAWEFGTADVYIDVYTNIYGVWVWTDLGPPRRAVDSVLAQHAAYHTRLAGQPVITTTRQALAMLEEYWNR